MSWSKHLLFWDQRDFSIHKGFKFLWRVIAKAFRACKQMKQGFWNPQTSWQSMTNCWHPPGQHGTIFRSSLSHGLLVAAEFKQRVLVALRDDFADDCYSFSGSKNLPNRTILAECSEEFNAEALLFQSGIRLVASLKHRDGLELAKSFCCGYIFLLLSRLLEI